MTAESVERARAAAQAWLAGRDEAEAIIAAAEAGLGTAEEDARRGMRRLLDEQGPDGSWGGRLGWTAQRLLTIHELRSAAGLPDQPPEVGRALDWLRGRQGQPGAWTDGCSPERHRRGLCHHFMGGFFSPAPPGVELDEEWLRCGAQLTGEAEIRFATSALALRCVLAWGVGAADVRLALEGLRRVVRGWDGYPPPGLTTVSLLTAVHALIESGAPDDAGAALHGLRLVAGKQRGDGSWVDADAFQALEVIAAAAAAGIEPEQGRRSLWHGARLLISTQFPDGSWGRDHGARRALIAWRTFRLIDPAGA